MSTLYVKHTMFPSFIDMMQWSEFHEIKSWNNWKNENITLFARNRNVTFSNVNTNPNCKKVRLCYLQEWEVIINLHNVNLMLLTKIWINNIISECEKFPWKEPNPVQEKQFVIEILRLTWIQGNRPNKLYKKESHKWYLFLFNHGFRA